MIHGAGNSLWPQSSRSWKDHGKGIETSGGSGKETKTSGDSGKAVETSGDSDREVAAGITDSKTKARNGVLVKHLVSN